MWTTTILQYATSQTFVKRRFNMFNQQKREPIKHTDSTTPDEVSVAVSRIVSMQCELAFRSVEINAMCCGISISMLAAYVQECGI